MKNIYLQLAHRLWLTLFCIGLLTSQPAWAQPIPDVQWTKTGTALAVTTDGNIISTVFINQGNNPGFPSVAGDGIIKNSLQGNQLWNTGLLKGGFYLGGKIPGYDYEAIASIHFAAATTDGGVAVAGKISFRGNGVAIKINANGGPRVWQDGDLFGNSSTNEDLIGTPDGGFLLILSDPQYGTGTSGILTYQLIIRKYDASGTFAWSRQIAYPTPNPANPDISLTKGEAVINTPDGGYLVTGYYNTSGKINGLNNSSLTENTGWLAKLDGQGNVVWQKLLDGLPLTPNMPGSISKMYTVTDLMPSADGTGYALVGAGLVPGGSPTTAILEVDWNGNFKRARSLGTAPTPAYITRYSGNYYAVGNTSLSSGADPQILKVSSANVSLNDPNLFNIVAQRVFDSSSDSYLQDINRAGDGSLVFLKSTSTYGEVVKLNVEPPAPGLTLTAPTYNCQTGFITFNTSGGDGSTITYIAPGVTRASATDNFGTVEAGLRSDPKFIAITATQNGVSVTYNFDLKAACSSTSPTPQPPVARPIPDQNFTVGQSVNFPVGTYFSDPTTGVPNYRPNWSFSVNGLPPGVSLFLETVELMFTPAAVLVGTATTAGVYTVTVNASTVGGSVSTSFKITVSPTTPPVGGAFALVAPDYNCSTGAITFKTTGGDGSTIEYQAAGITGWTTNPNQFVDKDSRTANDVKPFTLMARQSGQTVTYIWDLKATCNGSTPTPKPPMVRPIPDQTYTVGQSVYFVLGGYFSDPTSGVPNYRPNWSFSVNGLPPGVSLFLETVELMFTPAAVLVGTATTAGVYTVTVNASTVGGSVSTSFKITVLPTTPPVGGAFALIAPDYNCSTGAITFKTTGGDGSPIEYQAAGITGWTTNPNQFVDKDSRTANDVKPFTLMARQSGQTVTYIWDLKAACGRARVGSGEPNAGLQVRVLGNPVVGQTAEVEISGVLGERVQLNLVDGQGRALYQHMINQAGAQDQVRVPLGQRSGLLLLQVQTGKEHQTVKLLNE
ncbi:putative Ig domain-containing protein [Spirosoma jeollabukense]